MVHSEYFSAVLQQRYQDVRSQVDQAARNAGRIPEDIAIIAVSKTRPVAALRMALQIGIRNFGENYVQEARQKIKELQTQVPVQPVWHFIGHLQTNKVKYIAKDIDLVHSVDSSALAREINKQAEKAERIIPILLQVNTSGEESKFGCTPDALLPLAEEIVRLPLVRIQGLMTIAAFSDDPEYTRPMFRMLYQLRERLKEHLGGAATLTELSMGMSGDYTTAIEEGATMVRIGTAIFGEREYQ